MRPGPLRILRIADIPGDTPGGMLHVLRASGEALEARGHRVAYRFRADLPFRGPERLRRAAVPARLPTLVRQLVRAGDGPDVVELHEPIAALYALQRRCGVALPPLVVLSHGLEERGRHADLADRARRGVATSLRRRLTPLSVVGQAMAAVRMADHVVVPSLADRAHLLRAGVAAARVTCVPNGVDPSLVAAGAAGPRAPRASSALLFVGTWIDRKGVSTLVAAVARVLRRCAGATFTAAGCAVDPAVVLASFPADVRDGVRVRPHFDAVRDLAGLYGAHGILVLPSVFEGFPLVMLEAAAFGLAVVTTPACGMADFVEHGRTGCLVPSGDVEALAATLEALVNAPARAAALGDAARALAAGYPWARTAQALEGAYAAARAGA